MKTSAVPSWLRRFTLLVVFLVLGGLLVWGSFLHLDYYDPDAYGMIGHARLTGQMTGFINANAFFFIGPMMALNNRILNGLGIAWNDYVLAYTLVLFVALLVAMLVCYLTVVMLTGSRTGGVICALLVGLNPGLMELSIRGEDNLFSMMVHSVFVMAFMGCLREWRRDRAAGSLRRWFAVLLLGLALGLASITHRTLVIVWAMVPLLPLLMSWHGWRTAVLVPLAVMLSGVSSFLLAYLFFFMNSVSAWDGELFRAAFMDWFIPSEFYQTFYFWNEFGWDLPRQAKRILRGIGGMMTWRPYPTTPEPYLYTGLLLVPLVVLRRARYRFPYVREWLALVLIAAIHAPHSMLFESYNAERWDNPVMPLLVLGAWVTTEMHRSVSFPLAGRRMRAGWLISPLLIGLLILHFNERHIRLDLLHAAATSAEARMRYEPMFERVRADQREIEQPAVLLMTQPEYEFNRALPACYFSYQDGLLIIESLSESGEDVHVFQPGALYSGPSLDRHSMLSDHLAYLRGARVYMTEPARNFLKIYGLDGWFEDATGGGVSP